MEEVSSGRAGSVPAWQGRRRDGSLLLMVKTGTSRWAMDTAVVPCFWEVSPSNRALNIHCLASDMSRSASPGHRGEGLPPE